MDDKLVNSIYYCALFLVLASASMPILPSWVRNGAICLFGLYILTTNWGYINKAYRNWTLFYIFFFSMSALWALEPRFTLFIITVRIMPILLMVYATFTHVNRTKSINGVLYVVYMVALVMLFYLFSHIDEFVEGVRLGKMLNSEEEDIKWNSNAIGIILCFAFFSGYYLFVNQDTKKIVRSFFLIISVFMVFAIFMTGSRKSLIMLVLPFVVFVYKKRNFFLLAIILPIVAFVLYEIVMNVDIVYMTIGSRMEDMVAIATGETTGMEDNSRMLLIQYGLEWFGDNPIWGVGLHNFRVLSDQTSRFAGYHFYAHNNYIELLVDVGIIGFFLYYKAYIYLFRQLKDKEEVLSVWGLSFLIVMLFLGFGEVLYYEPFEQLFFCLIFCIVDLYNQTEEEECYEEC